MATATLKELQKEYQNTGMWSGLSSGVTPTQWKSFCRRFKNALVKALGEDAKEVITSPNHFDVSGFVTLANDKVMYFSLGDSRWSTSIMIRTANHTKDYTGGSNQFVSSFEDMVDKIKRYNR